ncbi:MAG: ABC transporter permease [Eubacterium sp.]
MKLKKSLISTPYLLWMIGFIILPLLMILYYAFTNRNKVWTLDNVLAIFEPIHMQALLLSLKLAFISTVICLIIAFPLALMLSRRNRDNSSIILFIFILPMWMNFMLRTLAWQLLLSNNGVINGILSFLGLPHINIINTEFAVVLGMVYDYLPFMILPVYNAVSKIDHNLINAAHDLGAGSLRVLNKIIIPLSMPGIISGITMVFIPSMTSFVISDLLGGGKILLIGNIIEQEFTTTSNWYLGSGLSFVLMIFVVTSMTIAEVFGNTTEEEGVATKV